ncbi:MAG TPA: PAS domain S-box protein [Desulfobulbus sp.]|nr:PAS domain S-box protein [Desulfobulbus sp.]
MHSPSSSSAKESLPANGMRRLRKLAELSLTLSGEPVEIFNKIARMIGELLEVKVVCLSEIQGEILQFLSVYDNGKVFIDAGQCHLANTPCATVQSTKDFRIYHDVSSAFPEAVFFKEHNASSYCGFPAIDSDGTVVAVICLLDDKYHDFTEEDEDLLRIFGQRIAVEIERKKRLAEKKKSDAQLARREAEFQAIFNSISDVVVFVDARRRVRMVNSALEPVFGYTQEELQGKETKFLYANPEDFEEQGKIRYNLRVHGQPQVYHMQYRRKNGSTFHGETLGTPVRDTRGTVLGYVGIIRDITERMATEHALKEKENFLQIVLDAIQDGISVLDTDFNVIRVNKIMRDWYSHKLPFEGKKKCYEVYHGRSEPCAVCPTMKTMQSGRLEKEHVPFVQAEGVTGTLELFAYPILDDSGEVIGVVEHVRDITEQLKARKALEKETLKAQKLESTGVLAGGIAHDFNNILTAIVGNISLAKIHAGVDGKIITPLTSAEKAAGRARDLSQQLLTFSKGGQPVKKPALLTELINESASFALTGSNVTCRVQLAENLSPVNIDKGQISQVIQNVVKNADQAMPEGGTVTISAENRTIGEQESLPLKQGEYVWIRIQDQGPGIRKEDLANIFDPYFSTKKEGSGLGLAVSFSIIKKHDGFISAESEAGTGTTFHIFLPVSRQRAAADTKQEHEKLSRSSKKILIMDDDLAILDVVTQMLDIMHFKVETATHGLEAVELYRKARTAGHPFDGVILDLTVPGGMGGKETMQELLQVDPHVKALVSSGYANDPVMAEYTRHGFGGVVSKPYAIAQLGKALQDLFD